MGRKRVDTRPLLLCSVNHSYVHLVELSWPVIAALLMAEHGWGYGIGFLFASLPGMLFGFGALPGGVIADRIGSFRTIRLGNLFAALFSIALYFTDNIYLMALELSLIGLSLSVYHPSGLSAVSSIYRKHRGKALGIHGIMGSIGQPLGPLSVGIATTFLFGWKALPLIWAALGLILAIAAKPRDMQKVEERSEEKEKVDYKVAAGALLSAVPLTLLFFLTFRGFYYRGITVALPIIYRDIFGMGTLELSIFTSLLFVSALPGHYVGGWAADKLGPGRALTYATILTVISAMVMMLSPNVWFFTFGIMLFGFSFFSAQPPANSIVAEITVKNIRGLFYGLSFATRFGIAFLGVILMGFVSDSYGLEAILPLIFLFTLVGLGAAIGMDRLLRSLGKSKKIA